MSGDDITRALESIERRLRDAPPPSTPRFAVAVVSIASDRQIRGRSVTMVARLGGRVAQVSGLLLPLGHALIVESIGLNDLEMLSGAVSGSAFTSYEGQGDSIVSARIISVTVRRVTAAGPPRLRVRRNVRGLGCTSVSFDRRTLGISRTDKVTGVLRVLVMEDAVRR